MQPLIPQGQLLPIHSTWAYQIRGSVWHESIPVLCRSAIHKLLGYVPSNPCRTSQASFVVPLGHADDSKQFCPHYYRRHGNNSSLYAFSLHQSRSFLHTGQSYWHQHPTSQQLRSVTAQDRKGILSDAAQIKNLCLKYMVF